MAFASENEGSRGLIARVQGGAIPRKVIILMNVESVEQAGAAVEALPLATAGFAKYDLMPVGPLGLLIQPK